MSTTDIWFPPGKWTCAVRPRMDQSDGDSSCQMTAPFFATYMPIAAMASQHCADADADGHRKWNDALIGKSVINCGWKKMYPYWSQSTVGILLWECAPHAHRTPLIYRNRTRRRPPQKKCPQRYVAEVGILCLHPRSNQGPFDNNQTEFIRTSISTTAWKLSTQICTEIAELQSNALPTEL